MKKQRTNYEGDSGDGDYETYLPEAIIQHILSFLSATDAVQMSLLSKTWYSAWSTHPILNLDARAFNKVRGLTPARHVTVADVREQFMNHVNKSLQRYENHNIGVKQIDLSMHLGCCQITLKSPLLMKELLSKVEKAVVEALRVFYTSGECVYIFPELLAILNVKPLTEFSAKGVEPLTKFGATGSEPKKKFSSNSCCALYRRRPSDQELLQIKGCLLRRLSLENVRLADSQFQSIISICPSIEILELISCKCLKRIKVTNLRDLKEFVFFGDSNQSVEVNKAPSLESFHCQGTPIFKLFQCQNLKKLSLESLPYYCHFFKKLGDEFPKLEYLRVQNCDRFENIYISSNSLKSISLSSTNFSGFTERPKINAPSILSFEYAGNKIPYFNSLVSISSKCKCNICILNPSMLPSDYSWFIELKKMLRILIKSKISLTIRFHTIFEIEDMIYFPDSGEPKFQVEELRINIVQMSSLSSSSTLLDKLFWTCRPKTLCIYQSKYCDKEFIKFLCDRLMDRTYPDRCSSCRSEFWETDLMEVKIEVDYEDNRKNHLVPVDWRIFVDSSPELLYKLTKISFRLQWKAFDNS